MSIITGSGLKAMRSVPTFGTVGAICEVVDNSIQWKTDNDVTIDIILVEEGGKVKDIMIVDNGQGMGKDNNGKEIIDYCLLFGGGTNHGATKNLGKFGIGLPYACCSQSEDYHVYSWQTRSVIKHKYRLHSETGTDETVQDNIFKVLDSFPQHFEALIPKLNSYKSGTIIQWKNCDRLEYKTAKTIIKHIERKLGRVYRYFIGNGVNINFKTYNKKGNSRPIPMEDLSKPIGKLDPLFLSDGTITNMPATSDQFGDTTTIYHNVDGVNHEFTITASIAKLETQKPNGQDGGKVGAGPMYGECMGISLVRANRELKLGKFRYPGKNGFEQRNRWWKIEVKFEPISDDLLNVNANKTDALNFRYIEDSDILGHDSDHELRRKLWSKITSMVDEMWKEIEFRGKGGRTTRKSTCSNCNEPTLVSGVCQNPNCDNIEKDCSLHNIPFINGICSICEIETSKKVCPIHKEYLDVNGECKRCEATPDLTEDEKGELIELLRAYKEYRDHTEESIRSEISWFVRTNKKHFVLFVGNNDSTSFFDIHGISEKFKLILVNTTHPYYINNIEPLRDIVRSGTSDEISEINIENIYDSIILFIITWSDTESNSISDKASILRFRKRFGIQLDELISTWSSN